MIRGSGTRVQGRGCGVWGLGRVQSERSGEDLLSCKRKSSQVCQASFENRSVYASMLYGLSERTATRMCGYGSKKIRIHVYRYIRICVYIYTHVYMTAL